MNRRLDRDEQADLAQARAGAFTLPELRNYEAYCAALHRLAELTGVVCDGASRAHQCGRACAREAPSGLPTGWLRSKWDACPACVAARGGLRAITVELDAMSAGDVEAEKAHFFASVRKMGAR